VEAYGADMGATEDGRVWCVKALHPSDPLTSVRGVPDQSAGPSTTENWQQQVTVPAPPDATSSATSWDAKIYFTDDPAYWGFIETSPNAGNGSTYSVVNAAMATMGAITATTDAITSATKGVCDSFTRWRRAYAGLTGYLVAPQLSNQGTITAAQYMVRPTVLGSPCRTAGSADAKATKTGGAGAVNAGGNARILAHPLIAYRSTDLYDYDTLQGMPNAFVGQARDGFYMPLKLDSNHAAWHTRSDLVYDGSRYDVVGDEWVNPTLDVHTTEMGGAGLYNQVANPYSGDGATVFHGWPHLLPCTSITGAIIFKGLSMEASLLLQYRMGYECACLPGTIFAPYLKLAPVWDPAAVQSYFAIARELKDAYPADYNDLGKLWDVIKGAARVALPFIRPVLGQGLGSLARLVAGSPKASVPAAVSTGGKTSKMDKPSAASVERAEKAASAAVKKKPERRLVIRRRS